MENVHKVTIEKPISLKTADCDVYKQNQLTIEAVKHPPTYSGST
jgi:hypothetical protein